MLEVVQAEYVEGYKLTDLCAPIAITDWYGVMGWRRRDDAQRAKELLEKVGARLVDATLVNVAADAELRKHLATG